MRAELQERPIAGSAGGSGRLASLLVGGRRHSWLFVASASAGAGVPGDPPRRTRCSRIAIVLARELRDMPPPLSLLDVPPADDGVAGARLAINDNNTTGRFLKQEFTLEVVESSKPEELVAEVTKRVEAGVSFVVADASPQTLLALADALKGRAALIFNAGASDDRLREQDCRANVVHTPPSRAMLGRRAWRSISSGSVGTRWFLVHGTEPDDVAFAEAMRRAAKRFGAKIVEERPFKYEVGGRRADGGHEQIQEQIPALDPQRCRLTTCWWSPTKAAFSASIFRTAPGTRGPWREPRGWCRRAGIRRSSNGARPSCRTAFDGSPIAPCARSTMMPGSRSARSARRRPRQVGGPGGSDRASEIGRFRSRRLQGTQAHLSRLGRAAAPADPACDRKAAGDRLAATGLPAPIHRARYARHRQAGDQLPGLCAVNP